MGRDPVDVYHLPQLESPALIVTWQTQDAGRLASEVVDFLSTQLGSRLIAEVNPMGFFPLGGVRFKGDLVHAPESKFWLCERDNLLIFRSDEPVFDAYRFLSVVLDFARARFRIKELYTLDGTVSSVAHTHPRRILSVFNHAGFKEELRGYELQEMTWEGPPAASSYLLWVAQRRKVPGVSLWPEIPFYLAKGEDPQAVEKILSFLNRRFDLGLDLLALGAKTTHQNGKIAELRQGSAEIDRWISMVERGEDLQEEEQLKLTKEIHEFLEGRSLA